MLIIKTILQAIGQAIAWIFPISESGHSSIFHDFSGRYTGACSQLTGVIHIGIAVGIIAALYKLFIHLSKNFFLSWFELFKKRLDIKSPSPQRKFMFMTILSFVPLAFYLVPAGKYTNIYAVFNRLSYNGNLLGEGICFALTGALLIVIASMLNKRLNPLPAWAQALLTGIVAFLAIPTPGCSLVAGVFCIAVITGLNDKYALRYSMVMSVMVLVIKGIIEICTGVTSISVLQAVIAVIFAAAAAFMSVKVLIFVIKKNQLKFFAFYDMAIGFVCFIIGVFEIAVK